MRVAKVVFFAVLFTISTASARPKPEVPYGDTVGWKLCQDIENFDCITILEKNHRKKIMTKRGGKIIKRRLPETWKMLWPDTKTRELVQKINRLNIKLRKGMFLAVPKDKSKTLADFSPLDETLNELKATYIIEAAQEEIHGYPSENRTAIKSLELLKDIRNKKVIIWSPAHLAVGIYDEKGNLVRWMPAIGGRDRCLDTWKKCHTVTGKFRVEFIGDKKSRSHIYPIGCPKKEPCALMAHFVGFYQCYPRERMCFYGFHASEKMEGKHASHGCVRLFLDDAKWLNQNFAKIGMRVIALPYPPNNK